MVDKKVIDNIAASTDLWISKVIMIVEDVESNYLFLNATLKRSGAEIVWVKAGDDAINIIRSGKLIDLILMDIQLEGKDGYSVTREIKELNPEIPIIAQTAFAMKGEKEKSIDAGCDEYLAKPIRPAELIFTISKYL